MNNLVYGFFLSLTALVLLLSSNDAYPQKMQKTTAGFLLKNGTDTLSIERIIRTGDNLEGRLLFRKQVSIVYTAALKNEGQIGNLQMQVMKPGAPEGSPALQEAALHFDGKKIYSTSRKGETIDRDTITSTLGAMAYHPNLPMVGLLEQIVMRAVKNKTNDSVPVFLMSTKGQTINAGVRFTRGDSAYLSLGNIVVNLKIGADGAILSGKTSNGQTIDRVKFVPDAALSTSAPDYSAPAGAPYKAEEVRIQTKAGHVLAGTLTLPENFGKPLPVVVTITGSSPQDRDNNTPYGGEYRIFRQLADELGRKGVAVLRMDDRGVGRSTGDFESATSAERADDIREGIRFLEKHSMIDKNRIALVGLSEGALIAPMIATTNKTLKGLVLLAGPASKGEEIFKYQLENSLEQSQITPGEKEKKVQQALQDIKKEAADKPWLRFFLSYDPLPTAKQLKQVPVLIMQGTTDKNVPPADAEKLAKVFKEAGNKNVTTKVFENYNHIFLPDPDGNPKKYQNLKSFVVGPEVLDPITNWIIQII